jgi:serine protease Do
MKAGDIITSFDGVEVADTRALVRQVGNADIGKEVRVVVLREGKTQTLMVKLGRRETAEGSLDAKDDTPKEIVEKEILGLTVSLLSDEMRKKMGLSDTAKGLVVMAVDESSAAFEKGMRAGDLITEAGQQKVVSIKDLQARIEDAKDAGRKSLLLLVRRAGEPRFVAIAVE